MASQQGVTSRLGLSATPGSGPLPEANPTGTRTWSQNYTYLGVSGVSFPGYGSFLGKTVTDPISGIDTWGVSWTEGNISQVELAPFDQWSISWSESGLISPRLDRADGWNIAWSESVSIVQSGVTSKAGTDTWSVSWTEGAGAVNVQIAGTDAWAVSWSEAGVAPVVLFAPNRSESWAVSWVESGSVNALSGFDPRNAGDDWLVSWAESGSQTEVFPTYPDRIKIAFKSANINLRFK